MVPEGTRGAEVVGRWLLLVVALGGLFAMHGLSDHGVGGPDAVTSYSVGSEMPASHSPGHVEEPPGDPGGGHGSHHGDAVVATCLAVLAAVLALGILMWRGRALRRLRLAATDFPALAAVTALWARARGPAPPDLMLLSIQRC